MNTHGFSHLSVVKGIRSRLPKHYFIERHAKKHCDRVDTAIYNYDKAMQCEMLMHKLRVSTEQDLKEYEKLRVEKNKRYEAATIYLKKADISSAVYKEEKSQKHYRSKCSADRMEKKILNIQKALRKKMRQVKVINFESEQPTKAESQALKLYNSQCVN